MIKCEALSRWGRLVLAQLWNCDHFTRWRSLTPTLESVENPHFSRRNSILFSSWWRYLQLTRDGNFILWDGSISSQDWEDWDWNWEKLFHWTDSRACEIFILCVSLVGFVCVCVCVCPIARASVCMCVWEREDILGSQMSLYPYELNIQSCRVWWLPLVSAQPSHTCTCRLPVPPQRCSLWWLLTINWLCLYHIHAAFCGQQCSCSQADAAGQCV